MGRGVGLCATTEMRRPHRHAGFVQFHIKREKLRARGFDLDDNLTGHHLLAFCDIDGGNRA
jgi:hypothetical protein